MSENNQQPKCLRIVVTAFFADGSSTVIDIPEPIDVKDESHLVYPDDFQRFYHTRYVSPGQYEFVLRARASSETPMRVLTLPVPEIEETKDRGRAVKEYLDRTHAAPAQGDEGAT